MIRQTAFLALLVSALLSQFEPSQPGGAIRGTVSNSTTSAPIPGASVVLMSGFLETASSVATTTDSLGRFVFTGLAADAYTLGIAANGYVRMEYGQRVFPGSGTPLTLARGQEIENLVVQMTPTGGVSGRIRDPDGQPLAGVPVQLVRYSYNAFGERILRTAGIAQMTDDRGEYRLYHVTPGHYYLNAGTSSGPSGYGRLPGSPNQMTESFTNVYYPGVADLSLAAVIEVRPGQEQSGMDMTLRSQQLYRVRGRVVDSITGTAPLSPSIRLAYYDATTGNVYEIGSSADSRPAYQDGTFEFRGIVPGSFVARALVDGRSGYAAVQAVNADVDNIVLTIPAKTDIAGRWRIEGLDTSPAVSGLLELRAAGSGVLRNNTSSVFAEMRADGTFTMANVMPGEYRVVGSRLPPGSYLKEARTSRADVLRQPLRIEGAGSETLDILISPRAATVEGTVRNANLEPVGGAQVVVVPDRERNRTEAFHAAMTDQNGRFSIGSIAPGDYRVFAWDAIETFGWFDPETLRHAEPNSRFVRLSELSRESVDLQVLPQ